MGRVNAADANGHITSASRKLSLYPPRKRSMSLMRRLSSSPDCLPWTFSAAAAPRAIDFAYAWITVLKGSALRR